MQLKTILHVFLFSTVVFTSHAFAQNPSTNPSANLGRTEAMTNVPNPINPVYDALMAKLNQAKKVPSSPLSRFIFDSQVIFTHNCINEKRRAPYLAKYPQASEYLNSVFFIPSFFQSDSQPAYCEALSKTPYEPYCIEGQAISFGKQLPKDSLMLDARFKAPSKIGLYCYFAYESNHQKITPIGRPLLYVPPVETLKIMKISPNLFGQIGYNGLEFEAASDSSTSSVKGQVTLSVEDGRYVKGKASYDYSVITDPQP